MRRFLLMLGLVACGSDAATGGRSPDVQSVPEGNEPTVAPAPSPAAPAESPPEDPTTTALPPVKFHIRFDYRFDTKGFFTAPERKKALEGAARIWGRLVQDDFATVPKGTYAKVRDPEHPTEPAQALDLDADVDDLVIFVGASELPGSTTGTSQATAGLSGIADDALRTSLEKRFFGTPFQPWTGWISFDESEPWYFDPDPDVAKTIPPASLDFVSVALHEIGHVLGFGTADAFKALATSGAFDGAKARAAAGGKAPALTSDHAHFASTVLVTGAGTHPLMDVSDKAGTRYLPTAIDLAVLEDLGFRF